MPTFNSEEEIKKYILSRAKKAVDFSTKQAKDIMSNVYLYENYYDRYTPFEYMRKDQIKKAYQTHDAKTSGNIVEGEVYLDANEMEHERPYAIGRSGERHSVDWSEEEILSSVMSGSHGIVKGKEKNTGDVWAESIGNLRTDDFIGQIKTNLIYCGIPIK